jgi:hypothetical protein
MRKAFSRLRALRESRDIRQLDLVIRTGLSPATIWRAEQPGGGGVYLYEANIRSASRASQGERPGLGFASSPASIWCLDENLFIFGRTAPTMMTIFCVLVIWRSPLACRIYQIGK